MTVLDLFHQRVAESPDRTAIVFGEELLTYQELDSKANDLAARFSAAGVGHGDLTPLLVGDGLALPLSAIALMKLAAPFVPLDESWPASRISAVLDQLAPKAVVCSPALAALVGSAVTGRPVVHVNPARLSADAAPVPVTGPTCDDLIYGFFTSGSTGVPKCALNAHLGLLNRFLTMSRRFAPDGTVVLQNSRHVFDSSIWQLLWPLTTGGTVVIPARHGILDLNETVNVIARHGVTMTDFVPSIFNTLVAMLTSDPQLTEGLQSLRRVLIGGEEISPKSVAHFRALLPGVRITNTYGPTECSIGSVFHEVGDEDPIPIGRPIDNTAALVLDAEGRPAAPGEQGEIHIGGDCVGRGYLNDPNKTAAAFVPNPFPEIPGPLLYRTGDLGKVDENGQLHFIGRRDNQVKLNGVRLELTEVEAALTQHPHVRDAKAVIAGEATGQRLVAFVLPAAPVDPERLREHLTRLLPAASVPRDIVELAAFPLTPNGKTDRRALAALAAAGSHATEQVEPANELERQIRDVWSAVLATDGLSTITSFFDAGGDSLTAQRLASALRTVIGRTPSVREIVTHPTIRAQAVLADGAAEPRSAEAVTARLLADSELPADIRRTSREDWSPGTVLLTGATGFVGVHLLHELLVGTSERVVCLVRAAGRHEARRRIEQSLERYGLLDSTLLERLVPLAGDLTKPRFGLTPSGHAHLADSVDTVVHSGAMVNLLLDYDAHRPANVLGTREVLRFMSIGRRKHLHHISTLGIFPEGALDGARIGERTEPLESAVPSNGYAQSKWVAERLVLRASERGLESSVHRLGEVGPHSGTGVPSDRGLIDSLLCAAVAHGVHPETEVTVDFTPVDHIARLVVAAVVRGRTGGTYHPVQRAGFGLGELFRAVARRSPVEQVPYRTFWHVLGRSDDRWLRLRSMLTEPTGPERQGGGTAGAEDGLAGVFSNASLRFATDDVDLLALEARITAPDRAAILDRYAAGCVERVHEELWTPAPADPVRSGRVGVR